MYMVRKNVELVAGADKGKYYDVATKKAAPVCITNSKTNYKVLTMLLISITIFSGGHCTLTEFPKNMAVIKGQPVTMPCATNLTMKLEWSVMDHDLNMHSIFNGEDINPEFSQYYEIDQSLPGHYDLTVKESERKTAMLYDCSETESSVESAELIVLDSAPRCNQVYAKNYGSNALSLICEVNYTGNWAPVMTWMSNNTDYGQIPQLETISNDTVKLTLDLSQDDMRVNQNFTCLTQFKAGSYRGIATAKNVPDYHHECYVVIVVKGGDDDDGKQIFESLSTIVGSVCGAIGSVAVAVGAFYGYRSMKKKEKSKQHKQKLHYSTDPQSRSLIKDEKPTNPATTDPTAAIPGNTNPATTNSSSTYQELKPNSEDLNNNAETTKPEPLPECEDRCLLKDTVIALET